MLCYKNICCVAEIYVVLKKNIFCVKKYMLCYKNMLCFYKLLLIPNDSYL